MLIAKSPGYALCKGDSCGKGVFSDVDGIGNNSSVDWSVDWSVDLSIITQKTGRRLLHGWLWHG
jgi:hypothetical protein